MPDRSLPVPQIVFTLQIGHDVEWLGSHKGAQKPWVERFYTATGYYGE
jgi:hypothetical protein